MKTAIIGGGKGCKAILEMVAQERLKVLNLEVLCVVDKNPDAPGMVFARKRGWKTLSNMEEALKLSGLELVIEVTGSDDILKSLYRLIPPGIRVMDHVLAKVFWDLDKVKLSLRDELKQKTELEAQLRKDRKHLQQILDSIPDAVLVMSPDKKIERVNARFYEVTGLKSGDMPTEGCLDLFFGKGGTAHCNKEDCPFDTVLKTGSPIHFIKFEEGAGAQEGYYEIAVNPIFDESGKIIRLIETARQITEQVNLKRETEENEERFRQFVDNAHDMITIKDSGGRYLVINPKAAALFGKKPEDFIGRTDFDVFPHKMAKILTAKDKDALLNGNYSSSEETITIQGEERRLDTVRFPLQDYRGDITGVCSIARDVTEQKKLARAVIQTEKLAAVGKLAAGVAHEINNPLTGILTFAEEMKMDADPMDPIVEDLNTIIRETMRCRRIVRDLLDYARLEKPRHQNMNVNRVLERALGLVEKQAGFQDVEFDLKMAGNLPDSSIDPNQLQQVFLNLIINASDAMKGSGKITITSELTPDRAWVEIVVRDQGHGISKENLPHIFEPFFSTKGQQGNGLGLSVVQDIVYQHGGTIRVDSEVGQGSAFKIVLPVARKAERMTEHG